jgi:hypothetical protein
MTTATAPTFTEEQIDAKMSENDYNNYLTMDASDVPDMDIVNWMDETGDEYIQERAQDYLDYKIEELHEAELTDEATPESVKLQARIADLQQSIDRQTSELAGLKEELTAR